MYWDREGCIEDNAIERVALCTDTTRQIRIGHIRTDERWGAGVEYHSQEI